MASLGRGQLSDNLRINPFYCLLIAFTLGSFFTHTLSLQNGFCFGCVCVCFMYIVYTCTYVCFNMFFQYTCMSVCVCECVCVCVCVSVCVWLGTVSGKVSW